MIKRFVWFVGGTVAGVFGTLVAGRRVRRRVRTMAPTRVIQDAGQRIRQRFDHIGQAVDEGRQAMHTREAELLARVDGRVTNIADLEVPLSDDDALLLDGDAIEPGRIVVLRDVTKRQPSRRRR